MKPVKGERILIPTFFLTVLLMSILAGLVAIPSQAYTSQTAQEIPIPISGYHYAGTLSATTPVVISVDVPLRNIDLLYSYAEQVSTPGSPLYHRFLTANEVKKLFYPTSQFNEVIKYLRSHDFKVLLTAADSEIVATGTAVQAEKYLGVHYDLYTNGTYTYYYGQGSIMDSTVFSSNVSDIIFSHPSTLILLKNRISPLESTLSSQPVNLTFPLDGYSLKVLEQAYNASYFYDHGIDGSGYNIGILDFFGDPTIYQQLIYFDQHFGIPNPPSFQVVPIGPYNPQLGITQGWAGEISLDVEASHAMAPGANITLYVASDSLPLPAIIAYIVSQDTVDVLSQSFSIPETLYSQLSGGLFYQCVVLTDQYYAMGTAEGITFTASSGDAGGSGYSAGPLGTVGYPSSSPFVLSVGGTTVYPEFGPDGMSFNTTAWSNYGFIPDDVNYGGSTGGVSEIEPEPWYQWSLGTHESFPAGRQVPDLSANANVYPGVYIVLPGNVSAIGGGTSEASPLTAGLLVLTMQYSHSRIGLLNPALYTIAQNSSETNAFVRPTFGYNIPWTVSQGYNLVTGWGSLNIPIFAKYFAELETAPSLLINETILFNGTEVQQVYPGETINVEVSIARQGVSVSSGDFQALLESTQGNLTSVPLTFNPLSGRWSAKLTVPVNASGIVNVVVYGESDGVKGSSFVELFSGYYGQFLSPAPMTPYMLSLGVPIVINITSPSGTQAPPLNFTVLVYSYNLTNNQYVLVGKVKVVPVPALLLVPFAPPNTLLWVGVLSGNYSVGVIRLVLQGAFGYISFYNGIDLQTLFILPPVVAEPGSVPAGSYIYIFGSPEPPVETEGVTSLVDGQLLSQNIIVGSNITAELYGVNGTVSETQLVFNNTSFQGYLHVPSKLKPGLYDVLLFANYNSTTLSQSISGYFYGQIYVSAASIQPELEVSSYYAFQGQTIYVYANLTNPETGTEVTSGMFTATLYPRVLSYEYSTLTGVMEVPLWYNEPIHMWVGNVTLPSTFNLNNFTYLGNPDYFATPFEIYVSGLTPNGIPTTTLPSAQFTFFVTPYTEVQGTLITDPVQPYYTAFSNDTIIYNGTLTNDLFTGHDYLLNSVSTITSSNVSGELIIANSSVTLVDVVGNSVTAVNSHIVLIGTTLMAS